MDEETKQAIADAETRMKGYADSLSAKYVKADSWWQTYRRENPLAVQNILGFGGFLIGGGLGYLVGVFSK